MTPENFCCWLQGFVEIQNPQELTVRQLNEIKNHLNLVFKKVTPTSLSPNIGGIYPMLQEKQVNTEYCTITC